MGIEFLLKKGAMIRSRWAREARRTAIPDLFTTHPACGTRALIADIERGVRVKPGEKLIVQCDGATLVFLRDMVPVATKKDPQAELHVAVRDRGCALARARKVYSLSGTVELEIEQ